MTNEYCPKCGEVLDYIDDADDDLEDVAPYYECPNGHTFDPSVFDVSYGPDDEYYDTLEA